METKKLEPHPLYKEEGEKGVTRGEEKKGDRKPQRTKGLSKKNLRESMGVENLIFVKGSSEQLEPTGRGLGTYGEMIDEKKHKGEGRKRRRVKGEKEKRERAEGGNRTFANPSDTEKI